MDQKQFDVVLTDAELRLRRLKVLYEQWFMGIERLEPAIPRKELEDLLTRLRKEPVSNTAQRFRLQQLVQRHVTFSTHWRRIGRQIEEGTYQRDLIRAQRRAQKAANRNGEAAPESDLDVSYDVDLDIDVEIDVNDALEQAQRAVSAAAGQPASTPAVASASAAPPLTGPSAPPAIVHSTAPRIMLPSLPAGAPNARSSPASAPPLSAQQRASLPPAPPPLASIKPAATTGRFPPMPPVPPSAARMSVPGGLPPIKNAPAAPSQPANQFEPTPSTDTTAAVQRAISPFALPAAGSLRPKPLVPPHAPAPPPPLMTQPALTAPPGPRMSRADGLPRVPAVSMQPKPRPTASPTPTGGFSSDDLDRVYSQYIAARARNAERTDNVKRETIEKTIRGMLPQLQQKHAGRQIDFDVVVRDGKVALKPVPK